MSIDQHIIHLQNGILHSDTPRSKVDAMIQQATHQDAPLVLHFHGGLVKYENGKETAERLFPIYSGAGGHPVFFVWESGLLEIIKNNLGEISQEKIFKIIWKRVRKILLRKMIQIEDGRDLGDLPQPPDNDFEIEIDAALNAQDVSGIMAQELDRSKPLTELTSEEERMLEAELSFDFELMTEVEKISNGLRDPHDVEAQLNSRSATVKGSTVTLMDPAALDQVVERTDSSSRGLISMAKMVKNVIKIAAKVIARFVRDRDHGLHATIVEEILHALYIGNVGGLVWKTMKKDTADSFGSDPMAHGGTAFLDSLEKQTDAANPPKIVLVGHSTGAVYISELLKKADAMLPPEYTFEVIFLAPASTFRLTAETIRDFRHRISSFRMFTMTDENEKKDRLVPVLYPHSLLYFVSGVVEAEVDMPIVGMQRFYDAQHFKDDKFPDVKEVRDYLNGISHSKVWSVTEDAGHGLNSAALKHGDFDNDVITLESLNHMIKGIADG
ncbi:hypothetical protein [Marinicella sp. W31]|uniref:hypothetical protein n=1 Tax=Marinicella sp. W31 TaxID=3023713 RepID=UPI00375722B3